MVEEVYFATGNRHKFKEALDVFGKVDIALKHFEFRHNEIRSDSLEEIARESAESAYKELGKPVFVEDSGLFIDALEGFPGTYSAWVNKKLGCKGILKLLDGIEKREARFEACIAYNDGNEIRTFRGICGGNISENERGKDGFGYDPVFVPKGESSTFAESITLKNKYSHRYKSLLELIRYLKIG
jgi:XTP/dITP diphosphohydrolase